MSCEACERVARYMAADPEMYRDEPRLCEAHLEAYYSRLKVQELEKEIESLKKDK